MIDLDLANFHGISTGFTVRGICEVSAPGSLHSICLRFSDLLTPLLHHAPFADLLLEQFARSMQPPAVQAVLQDETPKPVIIHVLNRLAHHQASRVERTVCTPPWRPATMHISEWLQGVILLRFGK